MERNETESQGAIIPCALLQAHLLFAVEYLICYYPERGVKPANQSKWKSQQMKIIKRAGKTENHMTHFYTFNMLASKWLQVPINDKSRYVNEKSNIQNLSPYFRNQIKLICVILCKWSQYENSQKRFCYFHLLWKKLDAILQWTKL